MTETPADLADRIETALLAGACGRTETELAQTFTGSTTRRALARVESALACVEARTRALGAAYPLALHGQPLEVNPAPAARLYRWLLALSQLDAGGLERGNRLLDIIGSAVMPSLLGEGTQVITFAWPPRLSADPRPEEFPEAIRWLGDRLGLATGHGYRSPRRKDGGVDLVATRSLGGSVKASPLMLVQTTVDRDLRKKARDIDLDLWRTWLDLGPAASRCLFVPYEVSTRELDELHASGCVVLDRIRVCEISAETVASSDVLDATDVAWLGNLIETRARDATT